MSPTGDSLSVEILTYVLMTAYYCSFVTLRIKWRLWSQQHHIGDGCHHHSIAGDYFFPRSSLHSLCTLQQFTFTIFHFLISAPSLSFYFNLWSFWMCHYQVKPAWIHKKYTIGLAAEKELAEKTFQTFHWKAYTVTCIGLTFICCHRNKDLWSFINVDETFWELQSCDLVFSVLQYCSAKSPTSSDLQSIWHLFKRKTVFSNNKCF